MTASLAGALGAIVGNDHVHTDPEITRTYSVDWTGRFQGAAAAVVRPATTGEVASVVAWCAAHGVAVVPQGGNTGLVGGSVPCDGEVVLHLGRMRHLGAVERAAAQVTVGSGVPLGALQEHARAAGLDVGVDLAARDSATVGGMAATNAGGTRMLRYGGMRAHVAGMEAVLGDGSVVSHLGGLLKDNTGYDLAGLLCGSEGTLGVITRLRLRLVPSRPERVVAVVALASVDDAVVCVSTVRERLDSLEAAELMLASGVALVREQLGTVGPFAQDVPVLLLLEAAALDDPAPGLAAALDAVPPGTVLDTAVAADPQRRAELWAVREEHTAAVNRAGVPNKLDVTLPLARMSDFVRQVEPAAKRVAPDTRCFLFGHLADGNLHVNVVGPGATDDAVTDSVLRLVAAMGGSISAEHGIGRAKRRWLSLSRSPAEVAAFRRVKRALDPSGILNPNVLLPSEG